MIHSDKIDLVKMTVFTDTSYNIASMVFPICTFFLIYSIIVTMLWYFGTLFISTPLLIPSSRNLSQ